MATTSSDMLRADYVIVGGGSSGCVLANRLSADPRNSVLLLEAGNDDRPWSAPAQFLSNLHIYIPSGFAKLLGDPKVDWCYQSEPEPGLDGRVVILPRGKVLGGSSSINGLVYVRGLRIDYDGWRQQGCVGWSFEDVLPYFRKVERVAGSDPRWQGSEGQLWVERYGQTYETADRILEACEQAGIPIVPTVNGENVEGVCYTQATVREGFRNSAARAYLHPARGRPNLRIVRGAQATGLVLDGRRCTGVRVRRDGREMVIEAGREIILSSGAYNSPHLLMLSGIGAPEALAQHGVAVRHALKGVGANLQDHYNVRLAYRLKPGTQSLNQDSRGLSLLGQIARFAVSRKGLLANAAGMITAFARTDTALDVPDTQLFLAPATVDYAATLKKGSMVLEQEPGMMMAGCAMRPRSRGAVTLKSADPLVPPAIRHNYLTDSHDVATSLAILALMRRIAAQPALSDLVVAETSPGAGVRGEEATLAEIRKTGGTAYHPVGTCRMGTGEDAVVDPQLRVHGIDGLRVADASIMPSLVSGNTNAACIMIAEKAADMIIGSA